MNAKTDELRNAHDALAEWYVGATAGALEAMPIERAVLDLFCELTVAADLGGVVGDVGSGTGRLAPYLAARGVSPHGIDLSPGMVQVARRDYPGFAFDVADLRDLPFEDASLAGAVCWYSLIFLAPADRPIAFSELARVVKPGGYLVAGARAGNGELRRGGGAAVGLGVEYDGYWMSAQEMQDRVTDSGFATVFQGSRPVEEQEATTHHYLLAQRT
ncbi:class I SAM-dependent methyltransferase [Catellatospora paridis]|uniref:class I SAM-dependent methyltransferase n=1 Tax=Catellatospora paridis TaxID=1617086 RepID=UPI0012D39169|nr:class I SAM-dependent methyltransferase [Catellatospora paridis]